MAPSLDFRSSSHMYRLKSSTTNRKYLLPPGVVGLIGPCGPCWARLDLAVRVHEFQSALCTVHGGLQERCAVLLPQSAPVTTLFDAVDDRHPAYQPLGRHGPERAEVEVAHAGMPSPFAIRQTGESTVRASEYSLIPERLMHARIRSEGSRIAMTPPSTLTVQPASSSWSHRDDIGA